MKLPNGFNLQQEIGRFALVILASLPIILGVSSLFVASEINTHASEDRHPKTEQAIMEGRNAILKGNLETQKQIGEIVTTQAVFKNEIQHIKKSVDENSKKLDAILAAVRG